MPHGLAPARTPPDSIGDADPVSDDDFDFGERSEGHGGGGEHRQSPMVGLRHRLATAALLHPGARDGDDLSVSARGEITGHGFTPVYHRRMVRSLSLNASQNPHVLAASFGASFDRSGGAAQRITPTQPMADELCGVSTVYRSTPVGTAMRTLSPETQARIRAAKQRARALRAGHSQRLSLSTASLANPTNA